MYLSIDAGRRPVEGDARILPSRLHARGQALRLHRLVARRARLGTHGAQPLARVAPAREPVEVEELERRRGVVRRRRRVRRRDRRRVGVRPEERGRLLVAREELTRTRTLTLTLTRTLTLTLTRPPAGGAGGARRGSDPT